MDYTRPEILATPDWLTQHLDDPSVRIIDCGAGAAYRRGHIPGAVELTSNPFIKQESKSGEDHGTFVMPPADFEALMRKLGVGPDTTVVTYDDDNARVSTRLWWVLRYHGHTNAKVLDGGWHRWLTEGRPVTFHAHRPPEGTFTANVDEALIADAEDLKAACVTDGIQILDTRSDAEWDGTNSRGNKRSGRVPRALHLEWLRFIARDDSRRFLPADQLQAMVDEAGFTRDAPIITYCQGGIRAAHAAFVLELLGYDGVRVYDGSMQDWANRDDTPLEA